MNQNQLTIPCTDYDASVAFYRKLGVQQIVDSPPRYARFETSDGNTFSVHQVESRATSSGIVIYFEVDDVDAEVSMLKSKGLKFDADPVDQSWLWREAYVTDPAGNRVCIYHAGENRQHPPWRMSE
jgi:catechol 2,3-dioxygenase-like lactoylglutathione lyase family enzyme